jgi:hypothetical protein
VATRTTYDCDLCSNPIESGRTRIEVTIGTLAGMPTDIGTGRPAIDLCTQCNDELATYLTERRNPAPSREARTTPN